MVVLKLSSSGKAVQVIDEEGRIFQTSRVFLEGLLQGKGRNFLLLTKLPFKVNKDRFSKSPTYNPTTGEKEIYNDVTDVTNNDDSLSNSVTKKSKERKAYSDKKVW